MKGFDNSFYALNDNQRAAIYAQFEDKIVAAIASEDGQHATVLLSSGKKFPLELSLRSVKKTDEIA